MGKPTSSQDGRDDSRVDATLAAAECGESQTSHPMTSRRKLLQGAGLIGAAAAAGSLTRTPNTEAAPASQDVATPAMRSPRRSTVQAAGDGLPALPPVAVIALNRAGFGPRPGDIAAFQALGNTDDARLQAWVDQQLDPDTIDDSECDAQLAAQNFETLDKTLNQLWADHIVNNDQGWKYRVLPIKETEAATLIKAVYSKRQLNEVLADFWHNHFNVFGWDSWSAPTWVHYDRDVIRGNMLGNFRQMLEDMAKSPAMLYYLNNESNTSAGPNENFARELFELHTMGAENYLGVVANRADVPLDDQGRPIGYIDKDVYQSTECFTGWRVNRDTGDFLFDESVHSKYEKIVLNTNIPDFLGVQDGEIVLDLLASHPGTARHICRKLCRRLISDNPPESVVQAAADVFFAQQAAPDQLKQVVRTIILSDEFRTTWGEKIKRPLEYAVSLLRGTNANFVPDNAFWWYFDSMGQALFQWHPPNGYPDLKEDWAGTMPILQRWRLCNWLMEWKIGGDGADKDDKRLRFLEQMPSGVTTPSQIADFWIDRLLGRPMPADERQQIVDFMAHGRNPDYDLPADQITERLRYMVALILMAPSFQWR